MNEIEPRKDFEEFGFKFIDAKYCWPVKIYPMEDNPMPPICELCFAHTMVIAQKICEPVPEILDLRDRLFQKG